MKNAILVIFFLSFSISAMAITRAEVLESLTADEFNLLKPSDFSEKNTANGEALLTTDGLVNNSVMAGITGPTDDISDVSVIVGLTNENAIFAVLMMAECSMKVIPEWPEVGQWVATQLSELGQANGGTIERIVGSKEIRLNMVPPNIVSMGISLK